jgi:hypothetical protein
MLVSMAFSISVGYRIHSGWNNLAIPGTISRVRNISDVMPVVTGSVYVYNPVSRAYESTTGIPAANVGFWALFDRDMIITLDVNVADVPVPCPTLRVVSFTADPMTLFPMETSDIVANVFYNGTDELVYTWSATGGTLTGDDNVAEWEAPVTPGAYTVTMSVTDGCATANATANFTVSAIPVLNITNMASAPVRVRVGETSNITATIEYTAGGVLDYTWTTDVGTVAGAGTTAVFTAPATPGMANIRLAVTDGTLNANRSVAVEVFTDPVATLTVTGITMTPDPALEEDNAGLSVTFEYTGTGVLTFDWVVEEGTIEGAGANVNWNTPVAGTYNVAVTVSDGTLVDTFNVDFEIVTE